MKEDKADALAAELKTDRRRGRDGRVPGAARICVFFRALWSRRRRVAGARRAPRGGGICHARPTGDHATPRVDSTPPPSSRLA